MKKLIFITLMLFGFSSFSQSYLSYPRVREANDAKKDFVDEILAEKGLKPTNINILLIGYKQEKNLQVWVKHKDSTTYEHLISYEFCVLSGVLGPKRQSGDCQVPEGFYFIQYFNPYSNFYLSLGLNYPNKSDKILGYKPNPGNNIYIHGNCVSIGCIPITDDKIKELYLLAAMAREVGQSKIPVYIFPVEMTGAKTQRLFSDDKYLKNIKFWENLKQGYDIFVNNNKELKFTVDKKGKYIFQN